MSLDVFANTQRDALDYAGRHLAFELPADFEAAFDEALRTGTEWSSSIAFANAKAAAQDDFVAGIKAATGVDIGHPRANFATDPALGSNFDQMNRKLAEIGERFPDLGIGPVTPEYFDEKAIERMGVARQAARDMGAREKTWGGTFGSLGGSTVAFGQDPLNIVMAPLGIGGSGIAIRAAEFAAIGGGTELLNELAQAGAREKVEPGYATHEAPLRVLTATAAGGVLGAGFGALARLLGETPPVKALPTTFRDEVHAAVSEAQIAAANTLPGVAGEAANRDGLVKALTQIVRGEPVTAADGLEPAIVAAARARLAPVLEARARLAGEDRLPPSMERLAEEQLADLRGVIRGVDDELVTTRARLDAREEKLAGEAAALPDRRAKVEALRGEVEALRGDVDALTARIPPRELDETTKVRLGAIELELGRPALTAERRTTLEGERLTITESLKRTGEQLSLDQELRGLTRAAQRKQRDLTLQEANLKASSDRIERRQAELARERAGAEDRAASRKDAAQGELRKSISRLAAEGYGLRLPREEAEALAARVAGAGDEDVPLALRGVSEELRTRPRAPEERLPPRLSKADADYWEARLKERVQDVATAAGRKMTDAEAGELAAHLKGVDEDEAVRALFELSQRPATILEKPNVEKLDLPPAPRSRSAPVTAADGGAAPVPRGGPADPALAAAAVRGLDAAELAKLAADPQVGDGVLRELDRIRVDKPEATFTTAERQADGSVKFTERPLEAVLEELEGEEAAARELMACVVGEEQAA